MADSKQKCLNRMVGDTRIGGGIWTKILEDLFFLHLKSEKSMDFEHKRGVPEKGKTENFGCFMAFSRSPNSPNREFKTKKHPSFSGVFYT